jgi:hypothetical protein
LGLKLESVTLEHLGRAARVVVGREHTTIVSGKGDKRAIDARCQELRSQIADTTSDYDREKLEERLALENAISVAGVLLLTEATMTEVEELKEERGKPVPGSEFSVPRSWFLVPGSWLGVHGSRFGENTHAAWNSPVSRTDGIESAPQNPHLPAAPGASAWRHIHCS